MPIRAVRTVRRSGRTISAETAASLRQIMGKHDEAIAQLSAAKAACQHLLDGNDQVEMEAKLARQWELHAPLS
jgi:hypothetical protein